MDPNCCSDRAQRLKAAKTDAAKEIEQYKQEKEAEFKKYEAQVSQTLQISAGYCILTKYSIPVTQTKPKSRLNNPSRASSRKYRNRRRQARMTSLSVSSTLSPILNLKCISTRNQFIIIQLDNLNYFIFHQQTWHRPSGTSLRPRG